MPDGYITRQYNDDGSAPITEYHAHRNFVPAHKPAPVAHGAAQLIKDIAHDALAQVAQSEVQR
jgi:hypothetical protein